MERPTEVIKRVHAAAAAAGFGTETQRRYAHWTLRFLKHFGDQDVRNLGTAEVRRYLKHLGAEVQTSPAQRMQACNALVFLFNEVLRSLDDAQNETSTAPAIMDWNVAHRLVQKVNGAAGLAVRLIFAAGLKLEECLALRIRDIDFKQHRLTVRGKNNSRRISISATMLQALQRHIPVITQFQHLDEIRGGIQVLCTDGENQSHSSALLDYFVFADQKPAFDLLTGRLHRAAISTRSVEKALRQTGVAEGLLQQVSCSTLRQTFASHQLRKGTDLDQLAHQLGTDRASLELYRQLIPIHLGRTRQSIAPDTEYMISATIAAMSA